ncbi:MAG: thioredoxin family protein [Sphingomonas sp.]
MKRSLGVGEWVRRGLGAAVLLAVAAIALGADTGFLSRVSLAGTSAVEQRLLDWFPQKDDPPPILADKLAVQGVMPPLDGATAWLNSPPLTREGLEGKVVLVDFWTYSCINCLRSIPYVRAWAGKYRDQGLVVIGVHTPEFAFEKDVANIRSAAASLGVTYPIAVDNDYAIWRAFRNRYWPAHYFIDAQGRIRHFHRGEGDYVESERVIQALLAEARPGFVAQGVVQVQATGAQAAAARADRKSPETYVGYARASGFASPGGMLRDRPHRYEAGPLTRNRWSLEGDWTVGPQQATSGSAGARISFRFHARDLHLVLGTTDKPVRFRVTLDGRAPGADHGVDIDARGNGVVSGQRLYQLIRQAGPVSDRTFVIEFPDPGAQAFAFTFG